MNLKNYLFLLVLLLAAGVRAQAPSGNAYPKREFRAAWIQAVNGQFRGIPTEKLKQTLVGQLNSLQGAGITSMRIMRSLISLEPSVEGFPTFLIMSEMTKLV